ncbi:transposase [Candidatus Kuenenia stuttgartiensis]|jgi:hypothetical protein|uniref:Transposase n=1 Tax=Kuenenia stuttgartiensis TaxID=174633 RepID=A0A6G7GSQ6_KUEST|nr:MULTISPECIES: hypothetical protein [Kuenenia]MBE7549173.1 hypothetical protein [Planctomycetia bacterium]MBW7941914.1 hypothetical protein [Candidatus Kuenenia stuttgartiensis]MBZ0191584.1 hypothetical protein [Candidatus Kuenenia stuttgartiensis]MCL4728011.1 hypothetical protein [Candidatus Kuenenia stuttgartiensis]MCZ7624000.1 hypothetical protein [Candidatus Kuenenia sp.]
MNIRRANKSFRRTVNNLRAGWLRTIEAFSGEKPKVKQLALFSDYRDELSIIT